MVEPTKRKPRCLRALLSASDSGVLAWAPLVAPGGPAGQPVARQPDDAALLVFTSGSTSRPKAVQSSQRAVAQALMNIDFIGALSGMTSPHGCALGCWNAAMKRLRSLARITATAFMCACIAPTIGLA